MPLFNDFDSLEAESVISKDTISNMFCVVLMMLVLYLLLPIGKEEQPKIPINEVGSVRVEIFWPDKLDIDVDLWVRAPNERPVGYSNKSGRIFNLFRDDLGNFGDLTPKNYEISVSRGTVEGEYTINVHWFSNRQGSATVPIEVYVTLVSAENKEAPVEIYKGNVVLKTLGEELTVVRFRLNSQFQFVPSSLSHEQLPLRSNTKLEAPVNE